jgi:lipopolysaccharide biosynthesis protein
LPPPAQLAHDPTIYVTFWAKPLALNKLRGLALDGLAVDHGLTVTELRDSLLQLVPVGVNDAGYDVRYLTQVNRTHAPIRIAEREIKLVAFYLPQFHPIPENDAWWGRGFTEWSQITKASPLYEGHRQPRLPADLGFYDLRVPETRQAQADLAREYGIYGFCYYYYWFNGRRILQRPLDEVVASGKPDFPFCICWANENWTRRWDGLDHDVLLEQTYSADVSRRFIRDVIPMLRDPRYIRYGGRPVLLVYRVRAIPEVADTVEIWRRACRSEGVGEIHLAGVRFWDVVDVQALGFDAAVDFPPHHVAVRKVHGQLHGLTSEFTGLIYDYNHVARRNLETRGHGYRQPAHRGVMLAWDNTPRRGPAAHIAHGATPELYREWLRGVIDQEMEFNRRPESLIFINAWNEWAEGANLEPDSQFGDGFLQATRGAIADATSKWAYHQPTGTRW